LRRNRAPHETQSEQNICTRDRRKAVALLLTRRSGTLRRAEIFDGPVVRAWRATPNQSNRSFPSGVARNARTRIGNHAVVIGRRNDEAIRLFSGIFGLLHFVRNDESGLLRHPLHIGYGMFFYRHDVFYRHVIPDGIFPETDLFFYRHSVPDGTHNPAITKSVIIRRNDGTIPDTTIILNLQLKNNCLWI
jgi:hypothetical protein